MAKKLKIQEPTQEQKPQDPKAERRQNLKNTIELIGELQKLLMTGHFPGQKAPKVIAGMQWLQSIADQCRKEVQDLKD